MSETTRTNRRKRLTFSGIDAGQLRFTIAQNLNRLESETDGDDYVPLWVAPRLLGIQDDDLVFLLVCKLVPAPELIEEGLAFYRSTFLEALHEFAFAARLAVMRRADDEEDDLQ